MTRCSSGTYEKHKVKPGQDLLRLIEYLRLKFLLEPENRLVRLHVDVECAKNTVLLRVDVRNELQCFHINAYANPVAKLGVNVLTLILVLSVASNLLQVQDEVGLELSHVEFEVADLGQLIHLFYEKHGIVLGCSHQQVVISQAHEAIKLDSILSNFILCTSCLIHSSFGRPFRIGSGST